MLSKCVIKHKRRTLFYCSYSMASDPKQIPTLGFFTRVSTSSPHGINLNLINARAYSGLAQNQQEPQLRQQTSSAAAAMELKDIALRRSYKDQYLSYLQGR